MQQAPAQNGRFNYYYPANYQTKAANGERLNTSEDAQKKIEAGELVNIPFLYNQYVTEEKEIIQPAFDNGLEDPRKAFQRYDLIFKKYHQFLKELIAQKKFDENDLRKYLLVQVLINKALQLNPSFAQIGKSLAIVEDKAQAEKIRETAYKNQTIGFNSESFINSDKKELQELAIKSKCLNKEINADFYGQKEYNEDSENILLHPVYDEKLIPIGFSTKKRQIYFSLEGIRITNLVIDEIIAQQRDIKSSYEIGFSYLGTDNQVTQKTASVFSLLIDVSLDKLKQEANLNDDILNAAKKVAKVLLESHKLYYQNKKGVANVEAEQYFKRYYNLYQNPIDGDHVYIPTEIQPLVYIYLNAQLTNKNINKIDQ